MLGNLKERERESLKRVYLNGLQVVLIKSCIKAPNRVLSDLYEVELHAFPTPFRGVVDKRKVTC